jgi:hypothetical protein
MSNEPILGQHCLGHPDASGRIFQPDRHQQDTFREKEDAIEAPDEYDDLLPALLEASASPARPQKVAFLVLYCHTRVIPSKR